MVTFKRLLLALVLVACPAFGAVETTTVNGKVLLPTGAPVTAGTITLTLSQSGTTPDGAIKQVVAARVATTIAADGAVAFSIVPNDAITPAGTYYLVAYKATTPTAASWNEKWSVTTTPDPVNVGAITRLEVAAGITVGNFVVYVAAQPAGACTANEAPRIATDTAALCRCVASVWSCAPASAHAVTDEGGAALTSRGTLNCVGSTVACTDDAGGARTNLTVTAGDVTGPASSTDNAVTRALGTTGKAIDYPTSNVPTLSDTGVLAVPGGITGNASTATALAADGADCSAGNYARGVDAGGAAQLCTADLGGDVTGPAASTDNALPRALGTTGKAIDYPTSNLATLDDTGVMTIPGGLVGAVTTGTTGTLFVNGGRITHDLDRDGLIDLVGPFGDWDRDGDLDDADFDAAHDAINDDRGLLLMGPGTWNPDADNDGLGESRCSTQGFGTAYANPENPHFCIRSNVTVRGAGVGVTVISKSGVQSTVPYFGVNTDGTATTRATARAQDITIHGLTVDGNSACNEAGNPFDVAFHARDVDRYRVFDVECRELVDACIHQTRNDDSVCGPGRIYRAGNYDIDGTATGGANCDPSPREDVLVHSARGGAEVTDSGYVGWTLEEIGGMGIQFHAADNVFRPSPLGESATITHDATIVHSAQTWASPSSPALYPTGVTVWLRRAATAPTGTITLAFKTTSGGTPTSTDAGADYQVADFSSWNANRLTPECMPYRFRNLVAATTRGALSVSTTYAIDLTAPANVVVCGDTAVTDTYTGGSIYTSTDGAAWSAGTVGHDFNFEVEAGAFIRPFVRDITVRKVSELNDAGGAPLNFQGVHGGRFERLLFDDTLGISMSVGNAWSYDTTVADATLRSALGNDAALRLGPQNWRPRIESVNVSDYPLVCAVVDPWMQGGAIFNRVSLAGCGNIGLRVGAGSRDVRFIGGRVSGTNFGVSYEDATADTDGVLAEHVRPAVIASEIIGTTTAGVATSTGGVSMTGLAIQNNTFSFIGSNAVRIKPTGTDYLRYAQITGNQIDGFGCVTSDSMGFDFNSVGEFSHDTIAFNTFRSRPAPCSEDRGLFIAMTGAEDLDLAIIGNLCTEFGGAGEFSNGCVTATGRAGLDLLMTANGIDHDTGAYPIQVGLFRDGFIGFGDGAISADVFLGRLAAGKVGTTDAGDDLVSTDCMQIGGTAGPDWCAVTAAQVGACAPLGALRSRTDNVGASACHLFVCSEDGAGADVWECAD